MMTERGAAALERGDKKEAVSLLTKAISMAPDYPDSHFLLARAYYMLQDNQHAVSEFEIFRQKMKALPSEELEKDSIYTSQLKYISTVYFELHESKLFISVMDEILSIDPKDQLSYYNLGVYYYTNEHNRPRAYQMFTKAIEIDPNSEIASNAKYAIDFIRTNPDSRVAPDFSFIDQR